MHFFRFLSLCALLALVSTGCLKDDCTRVITYTHYDPVYVILSEERAKPITYEAPRDLGEVGQLYYYADHIFINERHTGLHVLDNTDPENPRPVGFLNIPGNRNLAIRNGKLYADSYSDLLTLAVGSLSDAQPFTLEARTEGIFAQWTHPDDERFLSHYETSERTQSHDCETASALQAGTLRSRTTFTGEAVFFDASSTLNGSFSGGAPTQQGIGGSMARFTLYAGHLYVVDESRLRVFTLDDATAPELTSEQHVGWRIETIIPSGENLFIGGQNGMHIYSATNPGNPTHLGTFAHANACDPVFVKEPYAYVTLRNGTDCETFTNQLDLVDITDLTNPTLERSFDMENPHGLSIDGETLFVCEGEGGLKAFDISEPETLAQRLLDRVNHGHSADVILLPGARKLALVIGEDGFRQYDYADRENLRLLSTIPVN